MYWITSIKEVEEETHVRCLHVEADGSSLFGSFTYHHYHCFVVLSLTGNSFLVRVINLIEIMHLSMDAACMYLFSPP